MTARRNRQQLFVPAGVISFAQLLDGEPRFITIGKQQENRPAFTKQQREGLRYERRTLEYLEGLCYARKERDFILRKSPWIMFKNVGAGDREVRFCQPDAILTNEREKVIILAEIKLQHTIMAWRQIRLLYEPLLKFIFPDYNIRVVEVCKWFDPHSAFPEQYTYLEDIFNASEKGFGIHIYKSLKRTHRAKVDKFERVRSK